MKKRELLTILGTASIIGIVGCSNIASSDNSATPPVETISDTAENNDTVITDQTAYNELTAENNALKNNISELESRLSEEEEYYQSSLDFGIEGSDIDDVEIVETLDEDRIILQDANIREKDSINSEWIDYLLRYVSVADEAIVHVYGKTANGWYEIHYVTDEATDEYTLAYIPEKALSDTTYLTDEMLEAIESAQAAEEAAAQQTQQPTQQTQQPTQNTDPDEGQGAPYDPSNDPTEGNGGYVFDPGDYDGPEINFWG